MPNSSGKRLPRLAVIGVSGYGTIYLKLLRHALRSGTIHLVAAVIINPEQVADVVTELKSYGTKIYNSTEEFFSSEAGRVELCLIPTGIQWHARMSISAMRAGMNVLVEKPIAGSLADSRAIRKTEAETGRWVAVGFQDIYSQEAQWLKKQVLEGQIGTLREVRTIGLWPRARAYFERTHWAGRRQADGAAVNDSPLNNAFAHFVNLSLYFAGATETNAAQIQLESAELFRANRIEMFDTAIVRGSSAEGVRFWFGFSHSTTIVREPEIYLIGTKGRAEWWHEQRCVLVDAHGRRQVFPMPDTDEFRRRMFEAVLARLEKPQTFVCTTEIAEEHARLVQSLQDFATVRELAPALIECVPDARTGSELLSVSGLADALERARAEGSTLAAVADFTSPQLVAP